MVLIEPMFREALTGQMARVARLRPMLAALAPPLRLLAALGLHRRHLARLDLEQLDREARAAFSDPEVTARQLAALPDGRIIRMNARHWLPTEQPEAMRRAIEEWCDERFGR